jgi:hypothetical protein
MMDKTLALIQAVKDGASFSADEEYYDRAEVERLVRDVLHPLLWGPPPIRRAIQRLGINIVPNNFYSEIPDIDTIERSLADGWDDSFDYIFNHGRMDAFLRDCLAPFCHEFDPPLAARLPGEYAWQNTAFSYSDATAYYCFIRYLRPRTIVEVGCGWSTLVADLACKRNGAGRIICIDPFPPDFVDRIDSVASVVRQPVQQIDQQFFDGELADGDIFFIDSTHTVKHDSDCLYLYLKILPRLRRSVFIQAHDIFLPKSLPPPFLRRDHIYWTEQYLLMAYLIDNARTDVLYGSRYHFERNRERLTEFMKGRFAPGGASLWFSQTGTADPPMHTIAATR